ncbi:hypothetical protein [Pseudoalteromonas rubra]|uniref:C-methyltransferase domain-containing protein n=1 Tax=Pseudoalteromonas rubra TaxID=43658 RepID=A0A0F4QYK1_9GAMM|nr:hypothetical protein [Pseudoalteromonas rubra]KJZ11662.1 hypothetical protein TW77_05370 [Pseudoalteromonas rubra]
MKKKYIIFAPNYDENVGGAISMHRLCHLLNEGGEQAFLWHDGKSGFLKNKDFNTPEIYTKNLDEFIVVYMDVVSGNPINCPNVVRWYLNKPGFFTNNVKYGENELYFYFQEIFNHSKYVANHRLYVAYFLSGLYKNKNKNDRKGTCYMMRKGKGRKLVHDISDSVLLDGKSHSEIADVFNSKKYFYCYDLYSAYSSFAALCGCIPIIVPEDGLDEHDWQPVEKLRYGVAYGNSEEQILYALNTESKLEALIEELEIESERCVADFVNTTQKYFEHHRKSKDIIAREMPAYYKKLVESNNKVVLFGASESLRTMKFLIDLEGVNVSYLCDNDSNKVGKNWFGWLVNDPDSVFMRNERYDVLIVSSFHNEIRCQLNEYASVENIYSVYD